MIDPAPAVSKLRVVELREKKQSLGLDEYSRLLECFFDPRSIFDPVMAGQRSNFGDFWENQSFSTLRADIGKKKL